MAKGTVIKKTDAYSKQEQIRKSEAKLSQKLQADLESAIVSLFENSIHCDLELVVESDSILTHSCLLQSRVARFYKFLVSECQVLQKNGFSSIAIYNVPFISIRKFVENVYKNVDITKIEECILQDLIGRKANYTDQSKHSSTPESSYKKSHIALTPETDLFYTPQCSPSDIKKPFGQSSSESPLKRKENDITCYYKIVSVDDIQIDEKIDHQEKSKDGIRDNKDEHLEKELAEQDELFLSFKSIFSKVNKTKSNTGSPTGRKKETPKPVRKLPSSDTFSDEYKRPKAKLPLWKPNPIVRDTKGVHIDKQILLKNSSRKISVDSQHKKFEIYCGSSPQEPANRGNCSEMDLSVTGADSGVEISSSCQPEISPRENTVSDTSGFDLTDTTVTEDIPNDEEKISVKPMECINSWDSSDVGTWDTSDDNKTVVNGEKYKNSVGDFTNTSLLDVYNDTDAKANNVFCREALNEEEMARLDEMEKNMKECEMFIDRERQISYFDNTAVIGSFLQHSLKPCLNSKQTLSDSETTKDVITENKSCLLLENDIEKEYPTTSILSDDMYDKQLSNKTILDVGINLSSTSDASVLDSVTVCTDLGDNEHSDNFVKENNFDEYYERNELFNSDNFNSINLQVCDSEMHSNELPNVKTPPCSPKQVFKLSPENDCQRKSDLIYPEGKSNYQNSSSIVPAVNNFFIDASSLLDEDEILSPPISLLNFKTTNAELQPKKEEEENFSNATREDDLAKEEDFNSPQLDKILHIQEEERRQGDLIFKNSIPCFSRHEIENTDEAMERFTDERDSSRNNWTNNHEEVVQSVHNPSHETDRTTKFNTEVESESSEDYLKFPLATALATALPSGNDTSNEDPEDEKFPKNCGSNSIVKRTDAESLPIVSGGALPEDFSNSSSHISSPHLRRRNESAPILSGGMEYVEDENKIQRKPSVCQGAAWVVSFDDDKVKRRKSTAATSESDLELTEVQCEVPFNKQLEKVDTGLKDDNLCNIENSNNMKECQNQEKHDCRAANSIEKSASLGYFIEFNQKNKCNGIEKDGEKNKNTHNMKKNIFSMFIGMNDDKEATKPVLGFDRQNSNDKDSEVQEDGVKKPFYMFIESNSPAVKRKTNHPLVQKKLIKPSDASGEETIDSNEVKDMDAKRKTCANFESHEKECNKNFKGSFHSLVSAGSDDSYVEKEQKTSQQIRHSKLPLPLCKSNSLSAVNGEAKIVVWSEKKAPKRENLLSGETWLRTSDVQVTYTGKKDDNKSNLSDDEFYFNKEPVSLVPDDPMKLFSKRGTRKPANSRGGFHLRTVEEGKSPFKSPEERDSGVIVTEESDDSFVKLSDMDNVKNHYLEVNKKKSTLNAMTRSIPESGWMENKTFVKNEEIENSMSKSIGTGIVKSNSGTAFASDRHVSRSLSRLFPNLNFSSGFSKKSSSTISPGKQDTDPSDTQVSEFSEISSMQSSIEPSVLETSTETDLSCNAGTSRLGEDLLRMFLEEISPDVVVEVGGRRIKAHKCVLSSRCQYFAARLSGGWVESAGNVISLQGFSYNSVHFALCHIYSGENRIPDSLNIIELATLADMLCLEGLKEVISHTLKVKFCHCFHQPCDECHVGVLDCLPVAAAYGLDDLYRKCLHWINKYFVRVWPSKIFAGLPKELLDKCYQHHVVHMTVENVLDTILNIDTVRGSLPNVRWSETISRLVTKLHDAAIKYIADHFSSVLTSDNFLALGKEAGWSVGRLEDSLMKAAKSLPPEQACWSHARLHRILTVANEPDPPNEMDWNADFIDLLQCISGHVEDSLIKQAPRAAKSKAWRQMEPELRSKIQERACLVLPEDTQSPRPKRISSTKRDSRHSSTSTSSASQSNSKILEMRLMKLAMTQPLSRTTSYSRVRNADQRPTAKEPKSLKPVQISTVKKTESTSVTTKKFTAGVPEVKKITPSRFVDVKPRYLEPKSPQKMVSNRPLNQLRKTVKPLSSSDSSRNCSPLNANIHGRVGGIPNLRQHRDSLVSIESGASCDGKKNRSSARSDTPSAKTLSRLTADDNMSTDSLFTDSLRSEKDATTKKLDDSKSKGKENMRKAAPKPISSNAIMGKPSSNSPNPRKLNNENTTTLSYKSTVNKKYIASAADTKITPPKRFPASRITNVNQKVSPGRASLASPRNSTNKNITQKSASKYDANMNNGNSVKKKKEVDVENNEKAVKEDKRPGTVSRSGTFLKDEPTILKKPQAENIESNF